jgi:L-ascorbate metabolism protein UlaG (beta-lactamase superfamily)
MKIKFYGYNTFSIQSGNMKIAIDPGASFLYYFRIATLIPKSEWKDITHLFVTHTDTDHYLHKDRIADASNTQIICNKSMVREIGGRAINNTMDEEEALQVARIKQSRLTIPCHYNRKAFFRKKYNPADDKKFKIEVNKLDLDYRIFNPGDSIEI